MRSLVQMDSTMLSKIVIVCEGFLANVTDKVPLTVHPTIFQMALVCETFVWKREWKRSRHEDML